MKLSKVLLHLVCGTTVLALAAHAAIAETTVTLRVLGAKDVKGYLMISLHDEAAWSGTPIARIRLQVKGPEATVLIQAPAPGRYGIKVYQDLDGDGELARNIVGFPLEPIGFSNDAPIRLGPPSFRDAAFDVGPTGTVQTVNLR